jgi:hypothetical protein
MVLPTYDHLSWLTEIVIASDSYRSGLIGNVITFYSDLSESIVQAIACTAVTF